MGCFLPRHPTSHSFSDVLEDAFLKLMRTYLMILILACSALNSFAQTTGKLAGRVYDVETGEALPGANVILSGTSLGAACDSEGDFYIINIKPGRYDIHVSMIGYSTAIIQDLAISVNRTSNFDIPLTLASVEGQEVIVEADRISIEKDQTGTIRNISSDQMEILPVEDLDQVVAMQAGIVKGHIRGGRSSEVTYLLDGMQITESFDNDGKVVEVEMEVIQDLEVITGTFNAEYGRAMSGVINAVTKDGGDSFHGSISAGAGNYYTQHGAIFIGLDTKDFARNSDFKFNLSGPILKNRLSMLVNYRYQDNENHLNGIRRFMPEDYSIYPSRDPESWSTENTGDGAFVSLNYNRSESMMAKLSSRLTNSTRASLLYQSNKDEWQGYDHAWKYNPSGKNVSYSTSSLYAYQMNTVLSPALFFDLKLSLLDYYEGWYLSENPEDTTVYVHDGYRNNTPGFMTGGQQKDHQRRWSTNLSGKFDLSWQMNKKHFVKTGVNYTRYTLENKWYSIRNAFEFLPEDEEEVENEFDPNKVYVNYIPFIFTDTTSRHSDEYLVEPYEYSIYLQDKLEHNEIVLNYGVRYDYFNPNAVYPTKRGNPANQISYETNPDWKSEYPLADPQTQISPRFGMAYQLSDLAVLRFSYGHFFQMPPMYAMYQNKKFFLPPGDAPTTMGNAQLKAQKTVQYEVGVWQGLTEALSMEVAVYYRDIFDLLSAQSFTTYSNRRYGLYSNKDYGNVKGLEIKLDYVQTYFSAFLNYTLQYSRGNADNPTQNYDRIGAVIDPITQLIPMSWDQRHTFNGTVAIRKDAWGVSLTGYYNSGTPYNWEPLDLGQLNDISYLPNNEYMPSTFSMDMNANYSLKLRNGIGLKFGIQAYNLLDKLNDAWVDGQTGRAYSRVVRPNDIPSHLSDFNEFEDTYMDPSMYEAPRYLKFSMDLNF